MTRNSPKQKFLSFVILFAVIFTPGINSLYSQEKPQIAVGGALRFNYNLSSWKE